MFFRRKRKKVTYTIEDAIKNLYNTDYDYDDKSIGNAVSTSETKAFITEANKPGETIVKSDKVVKLKGTINYHCKIPTRKSLIYLGQKKQWAKGDFEVYLNLPNGEEPSPESKYYAGVMTFFGADHKHSEGKISISWHFLVVR